MDHVEEALHHWTMNRAGVIAELENIPAAHWDERPDPDARTLRQLARHIAEMGIGFADELLREDCSFRRIQQTEVREQHAADLPEAHTKDELIDLLRTTGERAVQRLRDAGESLADATISLADATMPTSAGEQSRLAGLWFAVSHEWYHRGQIATYARAAGCVPALTQQIEAMRNR